MNFFFLLLIVGICISLFVIDHNERTKKHD